MSSSFRAGTYYLFSWIKELKMDHTLTCTQIVFPWPAFKYLSINNSDLQRSNKKLSDPASFPSLGAILVSLHVQNPTKFT